MDLGATAPGQLAALDSWLSHLECCKLSFLIHRWGTKPMDS